jgi:hypothetical protein
MLLEEDKYSDIYTCWPRMVAFKRGQFKQMADLIEKSALVYIFFLLAITVD